MTRWFTALGFATFFLAACSTTKPDVHAIAVDPLSGARIAGDVNPVTDPTIIGSVDEAAREARIESEAAARKGRQIGNVAGVLAAVLGGPRHDTVDGMIDRYLIVRDLSEATGAIIGASKGATKGAQRGLELDKQFAELHKIEGIEVTRPTPDRIDIRTSGIPSNQTLANIVAVLAGREERSIDIEAADPVPLDIRDSLIELGLPAASISVQRNDKIEDVLIRIRYRY
jgi:hypothetical protein